MSDGIVLPNGYTRLEYIEQPLGNSGYIKTGITPSKNLEFEIKAITYDTISNTIAQIGCLFGSRTSATYEYQLTTYIDSGATNKGTLRIGQTVYDANLTKNELFHALTSGNIYHHNNTEIQTVRYFNDENPAELYVYCFNVGDGGTDRPRQFGHGKIYYLKFFTGSTLIRYYIPCKNPNGVVGLYDLVTSSFFSSEDTAFVAGPVVTARTIGISQKLIELQEIKEDLRSAINDYYNNEELTYSDGLVEYPDAIDGITVTSSLPTEPKVVNFIDYDGTLLYAYTAQEFRASEGLPHNPFHSGLVAQGWNWTRTEILDYLTRAERIDVGQMYITNDGATRYYIHKDNPDYLNQTLLLYQGKANGVLVDWGDGTTYRRNGTGTALLTHQYATTGDYVISLLPDDDCPFQLNERADSYTTYTYNDNTIFGKYYTTESVFILMQECYKVELGKGLTGISPCAFRYLQSLKSVSIPKNITTFGAGCFYLCFSLQCIVFPRNTERNIIVRDNSCRALNNAKYLCTSTTWSAAFCGSNGFQGNLRVESILVPDVCTSFGSTSFQNSRRLEHFYMSKNITSIGGNSFQGCTNLKRLNMPSLTTIPDAFRTCTSLQYLKFQEGTTTIANGAFYDLHSVYEIDLPSTITTIGSSAFLNCYNVRRIIVRATTPPTLTNVNAFQGAYVTNSGASYRSTGTGMAHFYVPYSADHSVLQAYLDSDATSSWGYYLTFDCAITELNADGTIPEEDWV